jgi:hypothetical protein
MKKTLLLLYASAMSLSTSVKAQGFLWAEREGDQTNGQVITTDDDGNSYVFGEIFANTSISGQSLSFANGDWFIAKYDNSGTAIWVKQMDSMEVSDMACNSSGVYLSGRYHPGASFNGTPMTGGAGWDGFILRLNASGAVTMTLTVNNPGGYESVKSLDIDNSGNIFATGVYGASATIGSTTLNGNPGMASMFLAKISSSGTVSWVKTVSSDDGDATGGTVRVAPSGDIYVMAGAWGDSLYFTSSYYNAGPYDAEVLVHYNSSGTAIEMLEVNHSSQDNITDMTIDGSGNVYTLQTNYLTSFDLAKYSASLDTLWLFTDGGGGHLSVRNVEILPGGQVLVAGHVGEDATFGGSTVVQDNGGQTGFLAFYSSAGAFMSVKEIPGTIFMGESDVDGADVYITGTLRDTASFDAFHLGSDGVDAMFLARYNSSVTGLAAIEENEIQVFPNPCSGILNCRLSGPPVSVNLEIYNTLGDIEFQQKAYADKFLQTDISALRSGIYFLSLRYKNHRLLKKIVISN